MHKTALLISCVIFTMLGCLPQHIHRDWEDSSLTKKEYLQRKMQRSQTEQAFKKAIQKVFKAGW